MAHRHTRRQARRERDDLAGEHPLGEIGQLALACLFAATWISDTFFLRHTTCLNRYVPPAIRVPLGVVLLVLSAYLAAEGLSIVFGKKREGSGVIRRGVFNAVRHPIYLSELVLYAGLLFLSISLAAAFVWGLAALFLHYISRYEERLLLARFGEEYARYMRDVPMWIPRLRRR
jgi:protein-S-isoprenylcysteine O-methyltransferase Ste14